MIAYLNGILEMKFNGFIVIDVAGVGYKVFMSETSINELGEIGDKVKIYTHYHVREDDISLYGFLTIEELNMFELLISVSGVGAKSALNTLANIEASSFALAVVSNDTSKLTKIPGIGAKTAARIILELKDKLKNQELVSNAKANKTTNKIIDDDTKDEAITALQVLGYNRKEIEKAFDKIDLKDLSLEEMIKQGLKYLSQKWHVWGRGKNESFLKWSKGEKYELKRTISI